MERQDPRARGFFLRGCDLGHSVNRKKTPILGVYTRPMEGTMKLLVSAIALLIGSNVAAMAGDQPVKFKLVTFYVGEKDGGYHMVGVTVAPDGSLLGTKDFMTKEGPDGKGSGPARILSQAALLRRTSC